MVTVIHQAAVNIPDLDDGFRLKARTMLTVAIPMMYEQFTAHLDVASMRADGFGSVITYAGFRRFPVPLPVSATLSVDVLTRQVELSGRGLGQRSSRLGFECEYTFRCRPGTGDPSRYRESISDTEVVCGQVRLLLTTIRRDGAPGSRVVGAPLPQTRHMDVHVLPDPHPSVADLAPVDGEMIAEGERSGVFGRQHTDTGQIVFTGEYLALLEDHLSGLAADAGLPISAGDAGRIAVVFREAFRAGDRFTLRGQLWRDGDRHTALIGIHAAGAERPHIFGRLHT
ncbi:hypothetical protein ACWT_5635 [Actinoplanes sp. SE50]|nr:hypothetical protein ACPL_5765 [Actinoplanes sp. SE50/110]ATO85050.1 hypothetical protein ACWT_5635 [Actinoplanes sp. SE50]